MPRWENLAVEFTPSELELLAREAAECGLTLAEFIHDAALGRSVEVLAAAAQARAAMPAGPRFNRLT
jgi:uncharacterized protein (DUF1778 family)